ncbi:ATP-binding protein [Bradyrhizobium sp. SZCCHNR1075]|uniref:ATP-binding protein n=1 Tax=Bradyrhizobium sp. SZCCHNR1075 TaxID=3057362 RepID=UPI0028EB07DA|nr:ATP-binding protein [Bradyrhizobium sp. SZCCHNR1075]
MTIPVLTLPSQLNSSAIATLAEDAAKLAAAGWPPELQIDFRSLGFVRPAGVVFLSNLISWLYNQGTKVTLVNIDLNTQALIFLDDSLFFEQHCGAKRRVVAAPRATTRPLKRIAHADAHAWLRLDLIPWLAGRLGTTTASLHPFQNCIAELFNNIQDHTRYDIGTIFAQHFPRENRVYVTLSDMGVGIPFNVKTAFPQLSDYEAIVKATEYGFSTKPTPRNQGIGLDYLIKQVVGQNQGTVTFCSGYSIVRFEPGIAGIQNQQLWSTGFCPGTTVDIVLRTDTIAYVPDEPEDLEW